MIKKIAIAICMLISIHALSQTKSTISLGRGVGSMHNSLLSPYNMDAVNFINGTYEKEKIKGERISLFDMNIGASSLDLDYNFANKIEEGSFGLEIGGSINQKYLYKLYALNRFSFYAGFAASLQAQYQVMAYNPVVTSENISTVFSMLSASGGVATSAHLRFKKVILKNTTSSLLLNAMLYPHYGYDIPLVGESATNYLIFTSIDKRFWLSNKLQADFPLYLKGKFINSFSVSYITCYENAAINGITYMRLDHIFNLGLIFKISKLNVMSE